MTNDITRVHVLKALKRIDEMGVPRRNRARLYELIFEGKPYPAKYALSLARDDAEGTTESFRRFGGGEYYANKKLSNLGFHVQKVGNCKEIVNDLVIHETKVTPADEFNPASIEDAREKVARLIARRRGQPEFR